MESRPEMKQSRSRISTFVVGLLAALMLFIGLYFIFGNQNNPQLQGFTLHIGISCIVISAFLFVFVNIASDIHYQTDMQQYYTEESVYYHTQTMMMLQDIASMLHQQTYQPPQQPPYQPSYMPESQYTQPQPMPIPQQPQYQAPAQQSNIKTERQQPEPVEETENEYKAQFKRPDPQKKTRPTTKDGLIGRKLQIPDQTQKEKKPSSEEDG